MQKMMIHYNDVPIYPIVLSENFDALGEALDDLLTAIKNKQNDLQAMHHKYVPIAVKIAPDLSEEELIQVADSLVRPRERAKDAQPVQITSANPYPQSAKE